MTTDRVLLTEVTDESIDISRLVDLVTGYDSGAVVTFNGQVRNHDGGREVVRLEYEGHPTAAAVLDRVVREVADLASDRDGQIRVAVAHRIGDLRPGDCALLVAVASAHREAAFNLCAQLVDEVKAHLPVWKHQVFADGSDEWVNCA